VLVVGANGPQIESKTRQPASLLQRSPDVIRLVEMMYVRFPLSLRNVEDLLLEGGIDLCHETGCS
jgi:putative transposase